MKNEEIQSASDVGPLSRAGEVTQLLEAFGQGDADAMDRLMPLVYAELHTLAQGYLRDEAARHTLQPTALVNEAYLRLVAQRQPFESRGHFLAIAATAMRRILVNHARDQQRIKRGGHRRRQPLTESLVDVAAEANSDLDLVALDEAMTRLAEVDDRKVRVVELRYFAGFSVEETAQAMQISPATVKRDWEFARVWLLRELCGGGEETNA